MHIRGAGYDVFLDYRGDGYVKLDDWKNVNSNNLLSELRIVPSSDNTKFPQGFRAPSLPANGSMETLESFVKDLNLDISPPVNFWTEASLFSEAGFKAIVFGPGDIANAHQSDEFVMIDQLKAALLHYKSIIQ